MPINAIVVEDEKLTADRLISLLQEYTEVEVVRHLSSVKMAHEWLRVHELPQIIFLDIQLGDGTGFDVLDEVKGYPGIIFTTAYDQYTLDAFKYNSIDYLLKPIKPKELIKAVQKFDKLQYAQELYRSIEKVKSEYYETYKSRFLFKSGSKYVQVAVVEIAYFYSHDGLNYARTATGERYLTEHTMEELQNSIDPTRFFLINRGVLVSIDHIAEIHAYFNARLLLKLAPAFEYGEVVVSREKVKAFKEWLNQ